MKYYSVRILYNTDESREYYKARSGDNDKACPVDLLIARKAKIEVDQVIEYYEHEDPRVTHVSLRNDDGILVAMSFDKFDEMVLSGNYQETECNKIAK